MKTLIHSTRMVLPTGEIYAGDLLTENGTISHIDRSIAAPEADITIDGTNQILLPGVIDSQVHFEHKEDLQTASHACARGGVTSFLEMANTIPLPVTQAALDDRLERAAQKCLVNYGFFIGATADNLEVLQAAAPTCGIKMFMGSTSGPLLVSDSAAIERIFANTTKLIAVHAENQARIEARRAEFSDRFGEVGIHSVIQDDIAALEATQLALDLATKYRHRLHLLHLSTAKEVELLRQHKPAWVTAEVTPQHLMLDTSAYEKLGSLAQMNPPLRSTADRQALWRGLHDGVLDCIATGHAPHTLKEKSHPYPNSPSGMPGVETSLPMMLTAMQQGLCRLEQIVTWMSANPARAYGIVNKGQIQVGYDADLVLVDLENTYPVRREDVLTQCGWSPFEGWELTGWPTVTLVAGRVVFQAGEVDTDARGRALQFESRLTDASAIAPEPTVKLS
ncbi:MAG: dihydroorotase [Cyanobacteria bacterium P01_F01_bin.33]